MLMKLVRGGNKMGKGDIVISDLCFIKFTKAIRLDVYTFDNVLVYERDNLI